MIDTTIEKPEAWKEQGEKLKQAREERQLSQVPRTKLDTRVTPRILEILRANAGLGVEDMGMGATSPTLRIHSSGSTKNKLADGSEPEVGDFYLTSNKMAYRNPIVHILYVKKCELPKMKQRDTDPEELKSNYVIAGVIAADKSPFVMYISGMSYNKVWLLQDQLRPWVKGMKLPMFSLFIKLGFEMEQDRAKKYKEKPVVLYEVLMDGTKEFPIVIEDEDMINKLIVLTKRAKEMVPELINQMRMRAGFPPIATVEESEPIVTQPVQSIEASHEANVEDDDSTIDEQEESDIADDDDDSDIPF